MANERRKEKTNRNKLKEEIENERINGLIIL